MLKLDRLLSEDHRAEFDQLAARPGTTHKVARQWLLDRGYPAGRDAVSAYLRRAKGPKGDGQRLSKLDLVLKPEDRAEIDVLVGQPTTTARSIHAHLHGKGYPVSLATVNRHMRVWKRELLEMKKCARFAQNLARVAADVGPSGLHDGTLLGFEQVIMERVFDLRQREELGARELTEWAGMLEKAVSVRGHVADLARKASAAGAAATKDGAGSPRPVVNGVEIANCVRRILGVPLPGEPTPRPPALPPAPPRLPGPPRFNSTTEHTEGTEHTEKKQEPG